MNLPARKRERYVLYMTLNLSMLDLEFNLHPDYRLTMGKIKLKT